MSSRVIMPIRAFETETVRIRWRLKDGGSYEQDVSIDPKACRDARQVCECNHTRSDHERLFDPESLKYFDVCNGCVEVGKKYPETHHAFTP